MADGIYVALSGALGRARELDVHANNLANVETPGYRESGVAFVDVMHRVLQDPVAQGGLEPPSPRLLPMDKLHLQTNENYVRMGRGALRETTNPLDLALGSDGYLVVQTPQGPAALASGTFQIDGRGQIVDVQGSPLLGRGGKPIRVPLHETVQISPEGEVWAGGVKAGELAVVTLEGAPVKQGSSYLMGNLQALPKQRAQVLQGCLEDSNVDPLRAMVGLIEVHRSFESLQTVIQTYRQIDRQAVADVGKKG